MAFLELGPGDRLEYHAEPPASADGLSFVFVNALTSDMVAWQREITPALEAAGHGTLLYGLRCQAGSTATPGTVLDDALMGRDLKALLDHVAPRRPVLVGLSIGGLFALRAVEQGAEVAGLVLLNTLRKPSLRLDWINQAVLRAQRFGGPALMRDLFTPLIAGPAMLEAARPGALQDAPYEALPPDSSVLRLLAGGCAANWEVAYESVRAPVLVVSGLRDRVFYDAADVAELTARLPDARAVELPEIGHLIPMECGAETARMLLDFAAEIG
jgi:pimeloyl-ACP methyl ester carboxylesterase